MINDHSMKIATRCYPNMIGGQVVEEKNSIVMEMGSSDQFEQSVTYHCYHCSADVPERKLHKHLFFAAAKCLSCSCTFETCKEYYRSRSKATYSNRCVHKYLKFKDSSKEVLKYALNGSRVPYTDHFSCDNCNKRRYVQSLTPLEFRQPWDSVFSLAQKLECFCPQMLKKSRFLVSKKPMEECPDCYSPIDVKRCICNIQTWTVLYECSVCDLPIYFVLDPPGGRPPRTEVKVDLLVDKKKSMKVVNNSHPKESAISDPEITSELRKIRVHCESWITKYYGLTP